jgi:hypothetical protein
MDLLDRVTEPGVDLLGRVDRILGDAGAPADHPVWRLLHRSGALPSATLAQVAALTPDGFRAAVSPLAGAAAPVRDAADGVPGRLDARGAAADGFTARWAALGPQITGEGIAARLDETAGALDDVAGWITRTRRSVAGEVGACLGSAEAVLVRSCAGVPGPEEIRAAADIAACVLAAVLDAVDDGWQRYADWGRLAQRTPVRTGPAASAPMDHHIELR